MTTPQDLFIFDPHGRKPLKEQVTPHKLSLLVLVYGYQQMLKESQEEMDAVVFTEREKRDFMTSILDLLQSPDLELVELKQRLDGILKPVLLDCFFDRLKQFYADGVKPLMDFFDAANGLVCPENPGEARISKSSVMGLFIRRMVLAFNKLSFSQVTSFHRKIKAYYDIMAARYGDDPDLAKSLTDSVMSLSGAGPPLTRSGLAKSFEAMNLNDGGGLSGGFYSQKQAEYFIAQQAFLLLHNEGKALPPTRLQEKITSMLKAKPDLAEAHFLSYLNSLRVKEYCTAVHNLYHYFDRNANLTGETTGQANKNREEDVCRRYAALNLAALQYRFGHKDESMAALNEAIRMAQETNDHICLQHALSWLHRLGEKGVSQAANLMERSVSKSGELSLPYLMSLGVQALAKHNAFANAKPASIFEYLLKSDILNCQHSVAGLMCVSYAQKAALWHMYGKRESSSMCSQLVLNLDTSESGVFHNGESLCIALCNLAQQLSDKGLYTAALDVVGNAKQRFPSHTQHAHLWMACEQMILFDRAVLNHRHKAAEQAVLNLRAVNQNEANLRNAILLKEQGEVTAAFTQLHTLLASKADQCEEPTPDFPCRVLLALSDLYIQTGNHTTALTHVTDCITRAKQHHLQYLDAIATVHLSFIQFHMKLPKQALSLLEVNLLTVLTNGSCLDQAKTLYVYAKCRVAAAAKDGEGPRKAALLSGVDLMNKVVALYQGMEAQHRVKDALYYQARLYNDLGYHSERNKCAHRFRQLDQQFPTLSQITVLGLG
ncbi:anaphase-promoting complex subunit 5-like isoform X1 [Haliotis rufescens]|uniref:anaphase-promoting complex subunit 5-like isoform X1 n=2 Tax=Haliotis rufescens TaxID=6454 RepID=UPI00201F2024|nr:anaphase-promoting complex subunit 5-like isoform X1 [Haliotis rufescens]